MYLEHFGLNEPPFRITPHTGFFYEGANRGLILDALQYAVLNDEGIVKVVGEVGAGKTMLCRMLMERLPQQVVTIYFANPSLKREEIIPAIAEELGLELPAARVTTLQRIVQDHLVQLYAQGKRVVVLIDEAHQMPDNSLEEIRLLSNLESAHHKLLHLVLFGQPELEQILAQQHMRQLRERITQSFTLEPLVGADAQSYIAHRLRKAGFRGRPPFSSAAMKAISNAAQGRTRRLNILADKSMLAAFSAGAQEVSSAHAKAAIADAAFETTRRLPKWFWGAAAALGGIAFGVLCTMLISKWVWTSPSLVNTAAAPASPVASVIAAPLSASLPVSVPAAAATNAQTQVSSPAVTLNTSTELKTAPVSAATMPSVLATSTPIFAQRLRDTTAWLANAPAAQYTWQVASMPTSDVNAIEQWFARNTGNGSLQVPRERVFAVETLQGPGHQIVVFVGQYPSALAAQQAFSSLPPALKATKPLLRTVQEVRVKLL